MKVILVTLHAKYVHASLALPCLAASCDGLDTVETVIREFTINEPADQVLRRVVDEEAEVVAFSCHIWNIVPTLRLATDLKLLHPATFVVLGGPEVSYDADDILGSTPAIDCVVRGEGEETFRALMAALAATSATADRSRLRKIPGITCRIGDDIVVTPDRKDIADLDQVPSPFALGLVDLAKPLVYVETSRGCPYSCAFCMSSLEKGVRSFGQERIRDDLALLIAAKVATIKLVDRTFNYDSTRANDIWAFILASNIASTFHFEIAADLLTDANFRLLAQVPPGVFRFEIGVQSAQAATLARIGRTSDLARLYANVRRLRDETNVIVHLDLIAGLPAEDFDGFLASLEPLFVLTPHHIQVEPLKVMKGAPMREIAARERYIHSPHPPYKILQTPWLDFAEICRIELMGRLLDLIYNSNRFATFLSTVRESRPLSEFFAHLARFWDEKALPASLPLSDLFKALLRYSNKEEDIPATVRVRRAEALRFDLCRVEYPSGKLAALVAEENAAQGKRAPRDLSACLGDLNLPAGSRVRTFVSRFQFDFLGPAVEARSTDVLFVYVTSSGHGQEVHTVRLEPSDSK
ncbi:MAG TPA: DUF4080 domain-containing protein [Geobacteraceae bacterium]